MLSHFSHGPPLRLVPADPRCFDLESRLSPWGNRTVRLSLVTLPVAMEMTLHVAFSGAWGMLLNWHMYQMGLVMSLGRPDRSSILISVLGYRLVREIAL